MVTFLGWIDLLQEPTGIPPAPSALRSVVRVLLGVLIAVLASYIAVEQIGTWRRRRARRD